MSKTDQSMKAQLKLAVKEHADKLISVLNDLGIECYIWCVANTGSVYIRFNDPRMGSIRLGDHDGKEQLKYKWNLRSDFGPANAGWKKDQDIWRYYLPLNMWTDLIPLLEKRAIQVKNWPPAKYEYTVPKFVKQNQP